MCFSDPVEVLTARTPDDVPRCLKKIERSGLWAVGFVSYEAAEAFDDALQTHSPGTLPLLQFGLFRTVDKVDSPASRGAYQLGAWVPTVTRNEYSTAIAAIKEHIAAGDSYQVNYTFRLQADFSGDPFAFFCDLAAAQQGQYAAFIETDTFAICSASPELFFELNDGVITSRPMKGTRARGLTTEADRRARAALHSSEKDRAENIMIVDMIRNDMGRIAESGSIETLNHFAVEKYPTVWQLTSTVTGKTTAALSDVFKNLFPCASITGAPKAKTMEIICGLEPLPRGVYTGAIGFVSPGGAACFNVAIRTAVIQNGRAEYGVGGGIVWDSDPEAEYQEALSKAAILTKKIPDFQLLETMLCERGELFLLERHLKRLVASANYFDFKVDPKKIRDQLCALQIEASGKVRLLLSKDGTVNLQWMDLPVLSGSVKLAIAKKPVYSGDLFLYHKTTNRSVYERARRDFPEADDVLLYNERGEVTESCIANLVVELDGRKVTPPVSCGLLAGTLRDSLLENGDVEEAIVRLDDVKRASAIWVVNSVRCWQTAVFC